MTRRLFHIILLTLLFLNSNSQGLHDINEKKYFLDNRLKKIKVFKDGQLNHLIEIDTTNRTVEVHSIPVKSGNAFLIAYSKKYYFKSGHLDSIVKVSCPLDGDSITSALVCKTDSTVSIYNYSHKKLLVNGKTFKTDRSRKLLSVDYYGYDDKNLLVLLIQSEGSTQFYYAYNDKGQIVSETIHDIKINYKYNSLGLLESRKSNSQTILYSYFPNRLLKKSR